MLLATVAPYVGIPAYMAIARWRRKRRETGKKTPVATESGASQRKE